MNKLILAVSLILSACSTPKLPDPTVVYPTPPSTLMEPAQTLQTIPEK